MVEEVRKYDTVSAFLDDCKTYLMRNECENNLILGICNRNLNVPIDPEKSILVAAVNKSGTIISCAFTTSSKPALAVFIPQLDDAIKPLVDYFIRHGIQLEGLNGKTDVVNTFLQHYSKPMIQSTKILLNVVKTLRNIELVQNSELELASMQDLSLLTTWIKNFQIDAGLLPLWSDEKIQATTADRIQKKLVFVLVINDERQFVSMAAIVRETDNLSFIGWVYTPPDLRNKGFASAVVYKLTDLILNTRQRHCALFTDEANPTSNKIYRNIGYEPVAEYLDICFSSS
ncbi:unnamed protein product [Adineta ricciae]|uniref:N-acetyltransferase domain-containing protein n=1 Tax=Adineta ricciae TaxID=249248 RepID=A0A814YBF5_ADIRI|nr:unnamed protein product [Adineta ricciae]CAF1608962.1 unnamed protein product [Adineta ricciae]